MPCEHVDLGDGNYAIVCSRGKRKWCGFCRKKPMERLCDWKVGGKTCDAAMCSDCALHVAKEKDICPAHRRAYEVWAARQPQLALALKQEVHP